MEQDQINENLNSEFFEFPLLNDMKEIISEFENSGVADKVEEIFNEMESELENNSRDSVIEPEIGAKVEIQNEEKSEFKFMLNEKDICDIDFEISKDIFNDVQIKNESFQANVKEIESNDSISVPDIKKHSEIGESICTVGKSKAEENNCLRSNVEVVPENPEVFVSVKENKTKAFSPTTDRPRLTSILIKNNKDDKNLGDCVKNWLCKSDVSEDKENIANNSKKRIKRTREVAELSTEECSNNKIQSSNDTIQSAIESVIKASLDENDSVEVKEERMETQKINIAKDDSHTDDNLKIIPTEKKTFGLFDVIVPLIGKSVMQPGNDTPFNHRYDLAKKRNELRAKFQQKTTDLPTSNLSYKEWRHQRESRSEEEKEKERKEITLKAIKLAAVITKIAIRILREYSKDEPNETDMIKCFFLF